MFTQNYVFFVRFTDTRTLYVDLIWFTRYISLKISRMEKKSFFNIWTQIYVYDQIPSLKYAQTVSRGCMTGPYQQQVLYPNI